MAIIKQKKGDLLGDIFLVILSLIIFFALYPAVKVMTDLAVSVNAGTDPTVDFLLQGVGFVMIFGMLKWIYNTVGNGSGGE